MLRNRSLLAISLVVAVSFVGLGMVVPVRVLYARSHGASLAIIGAMGSSFLLSSFLFQYPTGWLADLWGRRPLIICSLVGQAGLSLLYLLVADPFMFVVLRFAEGAMSAALLPPARALVADSVPSDRRGEAYGIFGGFFNFGFLLGPALGGLIATTGYGSAFVGAAAFRMLALVIVLTLLGGQRRVAAEDRARARAVPRLALATLPLLGAYILIFGDNVYFGFDLTLMPLWMHDHLGATVAVIGLGYSVWALPNIIGSPIGGRLADRWRRSAMIVVFGLLQVPLYVAYGILTALVPIIILFGVHGVFYAFVQPAVDATLAAASPPDARARVQSVYSAVGLVSAFLAANVLTALYAVNFRLPQFVMAAMYGACIVVGGSLLRIAERRGLVPLIQRAAIAKESAAR